MKDRKQSNHLFRKADHLEDLEDERIIAELEPDRNPFHIAIRLISIFICCAITSFQGLLPDVNAYSEAVQSIKSCYSVYLCFHFHFTVLFAKMTSEFFDKHCIMTHKSFIGTCLINI